MFEYVPLKLDIFITPIEEIMSGYADIKYKIKASHQMTIGKIQTGYNLALSDINVVAAQLFP